MKVSIITICYNSEATIEDTIRSVASQDYPEIEYIIVDGVSNDGTLDIVERHRDHVSTLISEKDKGIYDAMNKGVQAATGDIIGILNSDDFYANEHVISAVVQQFQSSGAEGLYADLVYVDHEDTQKITRNWVSGEYKAGAFKRGWMPPHPTFFVLKSCYEEYGLYNIDFRISADYELMLRFIHKHQIAITYLPQVITHMRTGGESNVSIQNRLQANREDRMAWKINGLKAGTVASIRKPLSKVMQFIKK